MSQRSPLLPIFLIVLVDVLGFTIVIPLLAFYAEKFGASPFVATLLVSVYAIGSLVSTPIIGRLSDRYGRRPLLLISQVGTCGGFLILGSANALWMVFLGRILDGVTAGNLSLAQAYISDHTKPENRAKAFGVIGIAFGIGFMFGPGLGGELGARYGMHVPFIVSAGMSALSILATYTLLPRHEKPPQASEVAGPGGRRPGAFDIKTYLEYFRRKGLGSLYLQFFLFAFAFSTFTSGFALFSERRFTTQQDLSQVDRSCQLHNAERMDLTSAKRGTVRIGDHPLISPRDWTISDEHTIALEPPACQTLAHEPQATIRAELPWTAHEVGLLFTYTGLLGILIQGGLIGRLVKKFGEVKLGIIAFAAAAISYTMLGFAETLFVLVGAATISAFGNGVLRPVITSRITQAVGRHEQGVALGLSGSLSSIAMAVAPPIGGALIDHHDLIAWALVAAFMTTVGCVIAIAKRHATPAVAAAASSPLPKATMVSPPDEAP